MKIRWIEEPQKMLRMEKLDKRMNLNSKNETEHQREYLCALENLYSNKNLLETEAPQTKNSLNQHNIRKLRYTKAYGIPLHFKTNHIKTLFIWKTNRFELEKDCMKMLPPLISTHLTLWALI